MLSFVNKIGTFGSFTNLLKKLYNTQHPLIPSAKTIIQRKKKIASIKFSLMIKFSYHFLRMEYENEFI